MNTEKEKTSDASNEALDIRMHAAWARAWSSLSPESPMLAWLDWAIHLATSPGKQEALSDQALVQFEQCMAYLREGLEAMKEGREPPALPPTDDRRFDDPSWNDWPYSLLRHGYQLQSRWWEQATQGVWGVSPQHQRLVAFGTRQWLEMLSPANLPLLNPVVLQRTRDEDGANLARGLENFLDDVRRQLYNLPPAGAESFEVGRNLATTPGKVVLKNDLIELIQYAPTTEKVHPEPILIVPAWIMKYYILDLSPHNSLIRHLVDQGHTVFCISWKNPDAEDRDLGMDEYLELGLHAALDAVNAIVPGRKIHATGYCLGGTLLAIGASAMARDGDDRLASLTLLAAQTDFSEPGELGLFIDESQVSLLEAHMAEKGYLESEQMSGAFKMLRSYDMVWARLLNEYLLGDRQPMNDLMAWNADGTRMPATMHSQYLRRLYLNNDLSSGRYPVGGRPISLGNLTLPIFCVGTTTDHVAPWRSVFKLHLFSSAEITFVLTNGGHNAGIVSEPGRPRRRYQLRTVVASDSYISADEWQATTPQQEGSWWSAWFEWLRTRSSERVKPPRMGNAAKGLRAIHDAPGEYVRQRGIAADGDENIKEHV
ncbi:MULTISPECIES: alpha/beta hydrolase [Pseudomonas]|uniref:Poly-beta-hydroxybutyrate polymerase n=1 Tax=Pseudomonas citronellolis TaxID=53408 RepID=A0A1A9KF49_9PSED|nr:MULTISPECIES: alpha/beta fold hydrolase [Pseudomonas]ANI16227.1 poly-beta-hydroxybutyrate polymerase [Pseudomonas citronellolis]EJU9614739.1 polyhydroxyalkanoic acid synthase [Pseudomonas aeruginosa]EKU2929517.1 polyhydroxyalkanoic acid synthase [Pseudomonas aeruginosa]ELM0223609.1 polyhydroxyalkanoic acid synthase [Pseudomonas aeruginosa]KSE80608.1 poly-beta-hydroxybutyrate polymerase [Pseudomonas aeruginosa]